MEYAVNELGHPVIYIINHSYQDQYVNEYHFVKAVMTLEEALKEDGNGYHLASEQDFVTGAITGLRFMKRRQEEKDLLIGLYRTGAKKAAFEALDIRKPFKDQLEFPLQKELDKAALKVKAVK